MRLWLDILALAAALLAPATAAAQHFKGTCKDSVVPGHERWPELKRLYAEQRELQEGGDLARAIEVKREVVRLQCHNHFHRYHLAELLVQAGDEAGAVTELEALLELRVNDLAKRLATEGNALHPLLATSAYQTSQLAVRLDAQRAESRARRERFRARVAALLPGERPPAAYVAKDACPFECCLFRRWSVLEDTPLYAAPDSEVRVGTAREGTHVEGLTGEVHIVPIPVAVVHEKPAHDPPETVSPGEIVFLLDGLGEGMRHVWHAGVVRSMSTAGEVHDMCPFPEETCWGEQLEHRAPGTPEAEGTWWVQVRLPDGTTGWTREPSFGGMDGCA